MLSQLRNNSFHIFLLFRNLTDFNWSFRLSFKELVDVRVSASSVSCCSWGSSKCLGWEDPLLSSELLSCQWSPFHVVFQISVHVRNIRGLLFIGAASWKWLEVFALHHAVILLHKNGLSLCFNIGPVDNLRGALVASQLGVSFCVTCCASQLQMIIVSRVARRWTFSAPTGCRLIVYLSLIKISH